MRLTRRGRLAIVTLSALTVIAGGCVVLRGGDRVPSTPVIRGASAQAGDEKPAAQVPLPLLDVAAENALPGSPGWKIPKPRVAADHQLSAFADRVSVLPGEPFRLLVSTPAPRFTVTAYRMGWYGGGRGTRRVEIRRGGGPGTAAGQSQPRHSHRVGAVGPVAERADRRVARRLTDFYLRCAFSDVPELGGLAATIDRWQTEILAYFHTGHVSNGRTEAVNLLVKRIKRVGFGFRNFNNYRLRLLLHCGMTWDTHVTTPIRGRLPRLAA